METNGGVKACLNCGKLVSPNESFCTSCGSNLKSPPQPGQAGSVDPANFKGSGAKPPPPAGYTYPAPTQPPTAATIGGQTPAPGTSPVYQGPPAPQYMPGFVTRKTDELAIVSLICGVASFVILPLLPAIAAIILGVMSRDHIRKSMGRLEGEGLAITGLILGIVNVALIAIGFVIALLIVLIGST
jgi:hypothetical protein